MPLTIVEVLRRADQGRTRPYLCRGDDDALYYVKGRAATRRGLIAEWLCAGLAKWLGLPVPAFSIAELPEELIAADADGWLGELGAGAVFASTAIVGAVEFSVSHLEAVDERLRQDIAVFDWWVRNADRTLTERGGNPNLLWSPGDSGAVAVIDHNLAFDPEFDESAFLETHVFADDLRRVCGDFLLRETYERRLQQALTGWGDLRDMIPPSWWFIDDEQTVAVDFSAAQALQLLERCRTDALWRARS